MFFLDRRLLLNTIFYAVLLLFSKESNESVNAFAFSPASNPLNSRRSVQTAIPLAETRRLGVLKQQQQQLGDDISTKFERSHVLTKEEVAPLIVLKKDDGKEKWINSYGLIYIVASIITLPIWWFAMAVTDAGNKLWNSLF